MEGYQQFCLRLYIFRSGHVQRVHSSFANSKLTIGHDDCWSCHIWLYGSCAIWKYFTAFLECVVQAYTLTMWPHQSFIIYLFLLIWSKLKKNKKTLVIKQPNIVGLAGHNIIWSSVHPKLCVTFCIYCSSHNVPTSVSLHYYLYPIKLIISWLSPVIHPTARHTHLTGLKYP